MYCVDINAELAEAAEVQRDWEAVAQLALRPWPARDWEAEHEAHAERAAIMAESAQGVSAAGLVSVPTKCPKRAEARAAQSAAALRRALRVTESDKRKSRIARLRRQIGFAARGHAVAQRPGFRADQVLFVTLTYRPGVEWEPQHIRDCLHRVRKALARRSAPLRYVWVAELQKRGAVHYHIAFWVPHGATLPMFDRCGWWPHGDSNIKVARDAVAYLMKYFSKGSASWQFPPGLRMHGCGGLEHGIRRAKRWLGLPAFIKARSSIDDNWQRWTRAHAMACDWSDPMFLIRGGWLAPDGQHWPSEFARAWVGDRFEAVQLRDYGRPFEASGPFSWIN